MNGLETILKGGLVNEESFFSLKEDLTILFQILTSFGQQKSIFFKRPPFSIVSKPLKPCTYSWRSNYERVNLQDAIGRISVEMVCPYPPGIPLLIPGETLDKARVDWLLEQKNFWPEQISDYVRVIS